MEIIRYLVCGGITTVVSFVSYSFFLSILHNTTTLTLQVSNIGSWLCAVIVAFLISRFWVFHKSELGIKKELFAFMSGRLCTLAVDMILMQILVFAAQIDRWVAKLIVQVIVTILNYVFSKLLFRRKKDG